MTFRLVYLLGGFPNSRRLRAGRETFQKPWSRHGATATGAEIA